MVTSALLATRSVRRTTEQRLDDLESLLRDVKRLLKRGPDDGEVALKKFATTGERAAPMTAAEVAIVLGSTKQTVRQLVCEGRLLRRWAGRRYHHPDDVRKFVEASSPRPPSTGESRDSHNTHTNEFKQPQ